MFKRMLYLLLALALLASCAYAEPSDALYQLCSGETVLGSGVLFQDQNTLLTTSWPVLLADDGLSAVGEGGSLPVTGSTALGNSLMLLTLGEPSPAEPLTISAGAQTVYILGCSEEQQPLRSEAAHLSVFPYEDTARVLFTAPTALLPGSVLVDEQGELCGVTIATYGEGVNRYMAMSGIELTAATAKNALWLKGFTATPGAGEMTVDWSSCMPDCQEEDCVIRLYYADDRNLFYACLDELTESSISFPAVPGRSYRIWLQHSHQPSDKNLLRPDDAAVTVQMPQAEPFALYDYHDASIYLSSASMRNVEDSYNVYLPPMESITPQTLSDPETAVFMQVSSSYTVEKEEEALLLTVLLTPEGYAFDYMGSFLFDPALQKQDHWNVELYPLLDDYLSYNGTGEFAPGEYTVCYYLDGALGSSYTWTLE